MEPAGGFAPRKRSIRCGVLRRRPGLERKYAISRMAAGWPQVSARWHRSGLRARMASRPLTRVYSGPVFFPGAAGELVERAEVMGAFKNSSAQGEASHCELVLRESSNMDRAGADYNERGVDLRSHSCGVAVTSTPRFVTGVAICSPASSYQLCRRRSGCD